MLTKEIPKIIQEDMLLYFIDKVIIVYIKGKRIRRKGFGVIIITFELEHDLHFFNPPSRQMRSWGKASFQMLILIG